MPRFHPSPSRYLLSRATIYARERWGEKRGGATDTIDAVADTIDAGADTIDAGAHIDAGGDIDARALEQLCHHVVAHTSRATHCSTDAIHDTALHTYACLQTHGLPHERADVAEESTVKALLRR